MKIDTYSAFLAFVVLCSACTDSNSGGAKHESDGAPGLPESPGFPIVDSEEYGAFEIRFIGDSYCGTISEELQIRFDCGGLAGTRAQAQQGVRDGRCVVSRTADEVAATILKPPEGQRSEYYPINVFSRNLKVSEKELERLSFKIEEAVLKQ